MARKLSDDQADELALFVRALRAAGRFPTWADFARDAGFPATNLSKVQLGKAGIDGPNLLALIQAAARRSGRSAPDVATTSAPVRNLEAHLEEVAELSAAGFARLEAAIVRIEKRLGGEGFQAPGRSK